MNTTIGVTGCVTLTLTGSLTTLPTFEFLHRSEPATNPLADAFDNRSTLEKLFG